MSGSFLLELDTTGPKIEVTAPSYTTATAKTDIWIYADEELSPYQDFYFIDSKGEKHPVVFEFLGDRFHGAVRFDNLPIGITTFYAQVRDESLNLSPVETVSINIAAQRFFYLETAHFVRRAERQDSERNVSTGHHDRVLDSEFYKQVVDRSTRTRKIEVGVRNE